MIFLHWLNAVRKELKALITGSLLLGGLALYQSISGRSLPSALYAGIALFFLGWAFFGAWAREQKARITAEKTLAAKPRVSSADWKELADRFEKRSKAFICAQWTHWSHNNQNSWCFNGAREERPECEQLCRIAGEMLLKSLRVLPELGQCAAVASDPLDRWLDYLRENHNAVTIEPGTRLCGVETLRDGEKNVIVMETINYVARASVAACLYCTARELSS